MVVHRADELEIASQDETHKHDLKQWRRLPCRRSLQTIAIIRVFYIRHLSKLTANICASDFRKLQKQREPDRGSSRPIQLEG